MSSWNTFNNTLYSGRDDTDLLLESEFNTWNHSSSPSTRTFYKTPLYGYVAIEMEDSTVDHYYLQTARQANTIKEHAKTWSLIDPFEDDLEKYKTNSPQVVCLHIKYTDVQWKTSQRSVATCVYNATNDYMKHMFGMALDNDDRDWYTDYDKKVNSHGCQGSWVLTVIHQLVAPYGLGIKSVQVSPGSMRYPEQRAFMTSLGANPFFVADGTTDNESALAQMNINPTSIAGFNMAKGWQFSCNDTFVGPYICLNQYDSYTLSAHSGAASYIGPRGAKPFNGTRMGIELMRLEQIPYHQPLELDPYQKHKGQRSPLLGTIKLGNSLLSKLSTPYTHNNNNNSIYSSNQAFGSSGLEYPPVCPHCQRSIDGEKLTKAWGEARCSQCNNILEKDWKPMRSL